MQKQMKSSKRKYTPYIVLWILFGVMVFWEAAIIADLSILVIMSFVLSIILLVKNGMPSKKYIVISVILMVLSMVAYLGVQLKPGALIVVVMIMAGIPTLFSSLAVFSVMENYGGYQMVSNKNKNSLVVSILIGVISGAVLSVINTLLGILGGGEMAFDFSLMKLLVCFNPAIFEEMALRAIFMAYCIYYTGQKKMNRFEVFTMYFMMVIPHSLNHGYDVVTTVMLGVLFGLPFALLQRKRDLTSAMVSHGFVDAVRFTLFGLGV